MKKNVNVITELCRKHELLSVVDELHNLSSIDRVIISPVQSTEPKKHFQAIVQSNEAEVVIYFEDVGVAQTIAKVIKADTGAQIIMNL